MKMLSKKNTPKKYSLTGETAVFPHQVSEFSDGNHNSSFFKNILNFSLESLLVGVGEDYKD